MVVRNSAFQIVVVNRANFLLSLNKVRFVRPSSTTTRSFIHSFLLPNQGKTHPSLVLDTFVFPSYFFKISLNSLCATRKPAQSTANRPTVEVREVLKKLNLNRRLMNHHSDRDPQIHLWSEWIELGRHLSRVGGGADNKNAF